MDNVYSDTSMLSDADRELVAKGRADYARIAAIPPEQRGKLDPRKQEFPIGIRPDGTVNLVQDDEDDTQQPET